MKIVAVGRLRRGAEAELFATYNARIRPVLTLIEVPDGRGAPVEIKRREADGLLGCLDAGAFVVALDQDGTALDSEAFSRQLQKWLDSAHVPNFVIGGAEGLDGRVLARANALLSLGRMTWPHTLARIMLAEQIYRARSLSAGHPYHRASRPA